MRDGTGSRMRLVDATLCGGAPAPAVAGVFDEDTRDASFVPLFAVAGPVGGVVAGACGGSMSVARQEEGKPLSRIESGSSTSCDGSGVGFAAGDAGAGGGLEDEAALRPVWRWAAACGFAAMADGRVEQDRHTRTESVTRCLTREGRLKGTCL
ncbi:hypothetical protein [Gluconacetobacter sp.]|uniref:hypothetical protein n=1 Tax=Gluconacetobacter sp. TaxID=1935994 RepID=UPI0039ECB796